MSWRKELRVIKAGGSLLDNPHGMGRLVAWLNDQPPPWVVVAGGGEMADAIRRLDERSHLSPVQAHRLAIQSMQLHAWILGFSLPQVTIISDFSALVRGLRCREVSRCVLEISSLMAGEHSGEIVNPLPSSWDVTSDSIAAWVAELLGCPLVLLKRRAYTYAGWMEAARDGFVDAFFPHMAPRVAGITVVTIP